MTRALPSTEKVTYIRGGVEATRKPNHKRPFGNHPRHLTPDEVEVWHKLLRQCLPGLLHPSDRLGFEILVRLATPLYKGKSLYTGKPISIPEMQLLTKMAAKFGLTPEDRCLTANPEKQARIISRNN
jgi:hypothetical protein